METNIKKPNLFNIQAEQIVLGTIILNNEYLGKVIEILKKEYFYEPAHQIIFEHIIHTTQKTNIVADSITLKSFFDTDELLKTIGGSKYLSILLSMGAGIVDIVDYAKIIQDLYKKRKMINICNNFGEIILKQFNKIPSNSIMENLRLELDKIEDKTGFNYNIKPALNILTERYVDIKQFVESNKIHNEDLLKTGFYDFDKKFNGLTKGELVILAGCSSMGKTTIANQIALNISKNENNCIFFSLETGNKQISNKILANKCRINSTRLTHSNAYLDELPKLKEKCKEFEIINYFIDDTYGINCKYINKCLKRFVRKYKKIDLIIIDYLQIMRDDNDNTKNRVREIGNIVNGLKEIAKKFNCVVICLSQLSRSVEARENHTPILRDLRDSGEIEQIADMVVFCYREFYYKVRERNNSKDEESLKRINSFLDTIKNDIKLFIAKNRNGRCDSINLNFKPEFSLINDKINQKYNILYND